MYTYLFLCLGFQVQFQSADISSSLAKAIIATTSLYQRPWSLKPTVKFSDVAIKSRAHQKVEKYTQLCYEIFGVKPADKQFAEYQTKVCSEIRRTEELCKKHFKPVSEEQQLIIDQLSAEIGLKGIKGYSLDSLKGGGAAAAASNTIFLVGDFQKPGAIMHELMHIKFKDAQKRVLIRHIINNSKYEEEHQKILGEAERSLYWRCIIAVIKKTIGMDIDREKLIQYSYSAVRALPENKFSRATEKRADIEAAFMGIPYAQSLIDCFEVYKKAGETGVTHPFLNKRIRYLREAIDIMKQKEAYLKAEALKAKPQQGLQDDYELDFAFTKTAFL